jgi:type I restriction enzyme S subunit
MAGEWKETTLGAIAAKSGYGLVDGPFGSNLPASCYTETGIPVIRGSNLTTGVGRFRADEFVYVSQETAKENERSLCRPGDIVFTKKGTIGQTGFVPDGGKHSIYLLSSNQMKLTVELSVADPLFVYYFVSAPSSVEKILRDSEATGVPKTNVAYLREFPISLPPLAEQKAIAAVLGALDDKIELNRRMNAMLEAMARALFSNWIQSHDDEIGEHLVQDLIDERVLVIGDGYRAKNSEFADDGLPFIRAGNLRGDGLDLAGADVLSASSVKAAGHKVGMVGDVAFTSKGTVGRITRVSSKTGSFVYSPQVCFWRSTAPDKLHPNVLYRWMSTDDFTHQVATVSTQTDMAPYVSLQDQRKMVIQLPPPSDQREIATQLEAIDEKIAANAEQSRTLAALRDALLPKLLSGELAVPPALGKVNS